MSQYCGGTVDILYPAYAGGALALCLICESRRLSTRRHIPEKMAKNPATTAKPKDQDR